jgi:hypothetical protein
MVGTKTTTLNLRINPLLKEALKIAAEKEHRSVANMIEVMIRQHCAEKRISIPDQKEMLLNYRDPSTEKDS